MDVSVADSLIKTLVVFCNTGPVHPDPPVPRSLVRTTDAVHRRHRPGGTGLCGPHGTGGNGHTVYGVSFARCYMYFCPYTFVNGFVLS